MYFKKTLSITSRKVFLIKTFSGLNLFFMLKPVSKYVLTGFNLLIKSNSRNIQTSFIIVLPINGNPKLIFLYFRKGNFLIFQEMETLKNLLYFRK